MFALSPAVLKPRGNYIAQFYLRGVGGEGKRKTHFRAPHTPPSSPNRGNCCLPHTFPPTCSLFTPPFPPSKNDRSAKFPPLTLIATGGQKKSPCSSCCDNAPLTQLTFLSPKKTFPRPNPKLLFLSLYFPDKVMGKGRRRRRGNRQIIFIDRGDLPFNNSPSPSPSPFPSLAPAQSVLLPFHTCFGKN